MLDLPETAATEKPSTKKEDALKGGAAIRNRSTTSKETTLFEQDPTERSEPRSNSLLGGSVFWDLIESDLLGVERVEHVIQATV